MSNFDSLSEYLQRHPNARAIAALDEATNQQNKITPGPINIKKNQFKGKKVVIIGSGVGGLTTAYELLAQKSGAKVTVLEALNRTGGRCLTLRTGDVLTEDEDSQLFTSKPGKPQVVRFKRPHGDAEPYLNAGPGRIPSGHKRLLAYLQKFSVDIQVYVMNSESNLVKMNEGPLSDLPLVYRRLDHNTRGWLAQMVHGSAKQLIMANNFCADDKKIDDLTAKLESLMITFGELDKDGKYQVNAGDDGLENGVTRAGYTELPGVSAGVTAPPIQFNTLLNSEFWKRTRFYQPVDFLWQPTLFQPVGGMDQVQHAFAQQVASLGGTIHLNSPVKKIRWNERKQKYIIAVSQVGTEDTIKYEADYVFCNAAMPFLKKMLAKGLQTQETNTGFENDFKEALHAVYTAQFTPEKVVRQTPKGPKTREPQKDGYIPRFLACTTKVGWQANRELWQGTGPKAIIDSNSGEEINVIDQSEVGVVPIFGGISWTEHDITQIWYPSNAYHDVKGTLTGTYNFADIAYRWGKMEVKERLKNAREGAAEFGVKFAEGLHDGLAIAWQNMPHIKGGWTDWDAVGDETDAPKYFNSIAQGTGVWQDGKLSKPNFFVVGDQISSLPGWQEGAIAAALNALSRMTNPDYKIPYLSKLPDTRLMVEGI